MGDDIAAALTQESKPRLVYACPKNSEPFVMVSQSRGKIPVSRLVCQRLRKPRRLTFSNVSNRNFYLQGMVLSHPIHSPTVPFCI
ncbi:MAG: hypothetical protein WBA41_15895 [Rivularia sp. (in: cyanobacteria)]